jgi:N6-L-threonylcarbamoyladenine synthase
MSGSGSISEQVNALRAKGAARILAFETSCDETSVAVVDSGRTVRALQIASQIDTHVEYGGVVPEIASRMHVEAIGPLTDLALEQAGISLEQVDAVAVTRGPGLVGALLVGVSYAKSLAYGLNRPLIGVHHIEGHISANYLDHPELRPPFLCLIVSGGHTQLVEVADYGVYRLVASTRDDAAGEAFDKGARVLGLPYPGGKHMDALAGRGDSRAFSFPRAKMADSPLDFSFSGLKTSLIQLVQRESRKDPQWLEENRADLAASFQAAIVQVLVDHAREAMEQLGYETLALAGGVAANSCLRRRMEQAMTGMERKMVCPKLIHCTDNGAMIGSAAFYRLMKGEFAPLSLNAVPSLPLAE